MKFNATRDISVRLVLTELVFRSVFLGIFKWSLTIICVTPGRRRCGWGETLAFQW